MESNESVTSSNTPAIRQIDVNTVHKICSGQVVVSLAVAVKELVENALDAGATSIDVRLKNYGIDCIEVSDNGYGVVEENFAALALKHYTSKLQEYSDLMQVSSFGFRGEALSSLCALSDLVITTRHKTAEYATRLEYDHRGNIVKRTSCSRTVGTTVTLTNLFSSLPVRQKEFHKNSKKEFSKMAQLLYAYCLISVGVKITCTHQTKNVPKNVVVATQGSSYKDNIASVFGIKQLQNLLEFIPVIPSIKENVLKSLNCEESNVENETDDIEDVGIDLSEDSNDADQTKVNSSQEADGSQSSQQSIKSQGIKNNCVPFEFQGFISSCAHGCGRSSADKQFYYVNSRPCEPIKLMKLVNEVYRQFNSNQYPFVFLNVVLQQSGVDVNVSPDKRKVFLTKEKVILESVKNSMLKLFESIPATVKIEVPDLFKTKNDNTKPDTEQPRVFNSFLSKFTAKNQSKHTNDPECNNDLKRKSTTMLDFIRHKTIKISLPEDHSEQNNTNKDEYIKTMDDVMDIPTHTKFSDLNEIEISVKDHLEENDTNKEELLKTKVDIVDMHTNTKLSSGNETMFQDHDSVNSVEINENTGKNDVEQIIYLQSTDKIPNTQVRKIEEVTFDNKVKCRVNPSNIQELSYTIRKPQNCVTKKMITDKDNIGKHEKKSVTMKTSLEHVTVLSEMYNNRNILQIPEKLKFKTEINPILNKKCEEELQREISKNSFKDMEIIGQFNLGFIITKLDEDLFIVDQHATDEIYNFETLQKTTILTSQKLVIPQQLDLTGVNEEILMDNLEIFTKNGFSFEINKEAPTTKRVKLTTIPMSKNWIFGKDDVEELLFMLREGANEHCRPSRVRAMFASRACRRSVMIGTALAKADMKKLIDHMGEIEKPWNCPHGRPTIRHLVNLAMVHTE